MMIKLYKVRSLSTTKEKLRLAVSKEMMTMGLLREPAECSRLRRLETFVRGISSPGWKSTRLDHNLQEWL